MARFVRIVFILMAVALLAGCSAGDEPADSRVERFFEEWVAAWSSGDEYDTVRFYESDVSVPLAQTDRDLQHSAAFRNDATGGEGRAWLARWLGAQVSRERAIDSLFVGSDGAAAIVLIDDLSTATWVGMMMGTEGIAEQWILRWRIAHLRGGSVDARLGWVDELVSTYVTAWSIGDEALLEGLYARDASIDLASGEAITGQSDIVTSQIAVMPGAELATISPGDRTGPAVFVVPTVDTRLVVLVTVSEPGDCSEFTTSWLSLDGERRIRNESRLASLETVQTCHPRQLQPDGWWTDLVVPPPLEEQVSSVVARSTGEQIAVVNGSPELERLLTWGLDRIALASLRQPQIDSVTFAPVRACAGRAGVVTQDDTGAPDLVLCTDPYDACAPSFESCTGIKDAVRFGLLHELAHAWMLGNIDAEHEEAFLNFSGASEWRSADVPWHERGVEQAADTIAWGLMDTDVGLVRLNNPSCERTSAGFRLLTDTTPLLECSD